MVISESVKTDKLVVGGFAAGVIALGLSALLGWHFDIAFLKSFIPGKASMNPLSGLTFILAGIGLCAFSIPLATRILGGLVVLLSISRLLGLVGLDIQLDRMFYAEALAQNRMAPNSAFCFLLAGCSLMLLNSNSTHIRRFANFCNILCLG
ncbi:MAG: hypothetical protein K2P92_06420, partial [Bdellovibrionaceae bacterium]|nr:hypothetical protein [Pseudobdellovibrionaceae bacterium]